MAASWNNLPLERKKKTVIKSSHNYFPDAKIKDKSKIKRGNNQTLPCLLIIKLSLYWLSLDRLWFLLIELFDNDDDTLPMMIEERNIAFMKWLASNKV